MSLLTVKEAAEVLGMKESKLRYEMSLDNHTWQGVLVTQVGHRLYLDRDGVERLMRQQQTRRKATDREMWRNGLAPDHDTPVCAWCGDPAQVQYVYEHRHAGQTYSSPAYCGDDCHTEAVGL